jgi:quinol monooxygenase YgiN
MAATGILISGRAKAGKRDALYSLYLEHVVPHLEASDNVETVVWSADRDDDDAYHLLEIFKSAGDQQSVLGSDWFRAYMALAAPLAAEPPVVHSLETRWTKGIG